MYVCFIYIYIYIYIYMYMYIIIIIIPNYREEEWIPVFVIVKEDAFRG